MKTALYSFLFLVGLTALAACDTDAENIGYEPQHNVDYEALKAYKQSDHEIMFGWFGNWDGGGASASGSLMSLPDSVDMVSIWGAPWPLSEKQSQDMQNVRNVKGTKVIACIFTPYLGRYIDLPEGVDRLEYWGWGDTNEEKMAAIRKYGIALAQEVLKWGYDGLDIDNEPEQRSYSPHFYSNTTYFTAFIKALGELIGPESGTGHVLQIDGHLTTGLTNDMDKYFTYFVSQSYEATSYTNYDSRFNTVDNFYTGTSRADLAKKFMVTEDFEKLWSTGGNASRNRDNTSDRASIVMAKWHPQENGEDLPKAGAGLYHIENEYRSTVRPYNFTRSMIQIMSPAPGSAQETLEP